MPIGTGAVLALALTGCAHRPAAPGDALQSYAAALERKDYAAAYSLMSAAYRQRVSAAEFRRQLDADGTEMANDARALREGAQRWGARVEVAVGNDETVTLVREADAWRLDGTPFEPYGQATPRAALRTFVRAVENRRYDVLLRLVPSRYRAVVSADKLRSFWEGEQGGRNRGLLRELRMALDARIAEEGDEAFLTYGANRQVKFVREDGAWRIESPE
jgi:hypothetical protein